MAAAVVVVAAAADMDCNYNWISACLHVGAKECQSQPIYNLQNLTLLMKTFILPIFI